MASLEPSEFSSDQLDTFITALANVDKDNDGEIDWNDFNVFCDQQQVSMDQRKSIWKQLGGTIDNESLNNSFISIPNDNNINNIINDDNLSNDSQIFHSQDDDDNTYDHDDKENDGDDDLDENESNELILEFEISDHREININGNKDNINPTTPSINQSRPKAMRSKSEGFILSPQVIHTNYNGLADIASTFKQFDGEKDGKLFQSEFISMMIDLYPNIDENSISELFKLLDIDNCGDFRYDQGNNLQILQEKLDNYAKNMLHCYEFCNELKAVYCDNNYNGHALNHVYPKNDSIGIGIRGDFGSNSSEYEYNEDDPIQCAYILKKELDYALSLNSTEKAKALSLSSRDLWKWINDVGITSFNENSILRKRINDITLKNELLETELNDYKQQCKDIEYELQQTKQAKHHLTLSCDSLQSELEQMAIQLSQEQCLSDSNNMQLDKLKSSLELSKATIKSLKSRKKSLTNSYSQTERKQKQIHSQNKEKEKEKEKEFKILIESQNKVYSKNVSCDIENDNEFMDTQIMETIEIPQHRRNESYDLPNESLLIGHFRSAPATTDEEHDEIELTNDERDIFEEDEEKDRDIHDIKEYTNDPLPRSILRRKTIQVGDSENLGGSLTTNLDTVDSEDINENASYQPSYSNLPNNAALDNIQISLDEQQQKLDVIIDLVKSLEDNGNLQQNIQTINQTMAQILDIKNSKNPETDNKDLNGIPSGLKKILPLLMMGFVCLSGYTTYKYTQRRR